LRLTGEGEGSGERKKHGQLPTHGGAAVGTPVKAASILGKAGIGFTRVNY